MVTIEKNLREAVRKAVAKYKGGKTRTLVAKPPVETRITFMTSLFADAAELLPIAKRTDAFKVEYSSNSMTEAYKTFELLAIASNGLFAMLDRLR